ncbi:MAG: cupredoxin domain-containing protein [Hydrogenothermus sp.]|nr:MAG: cupredoxin domain-containing protein [Hydrogenothermus sp.]
MRIIFLLLASLFFVVSCSKVDENAKPDVVVNIKVSKLGYSPSVVEVPYEKVVLFRITAVDEGIGDDYSQEYYGHCFYILPPYDVMVSNIKKGETKEIKIKTVFKGKFIFTCPYCSGVFPTKGDLIVKD